MAPWQPDEPFELPSGQLVCGLHHLKICGHCCVDYTFMSEGEEDPNLDDYTEPTRFAVDMDDFHSNLSPFLPSPYSTTELEYRSDGTLVVPSIGTFNPRSATATPQELFPPSTRATRQWPRFIYHANDRDFLIFTDGACLNNGQRNPKAGWGFVFRGPTTRCPLIGTVSGRLENQGPSGEAHPQTSNRAELRAVIAALKFRAWFGEGWHRLVLATDSEYVTKGATEWVRTWGANGWRTSKGTAVKNQDLWEELLRDVIRSRQEGLEICFWRIPRAWNQEADQAAKNGASKEETEKFSRIMGAAV